MQPGGIARQVQKCDSGRQFVNPEWQDCEGGLEKTLGTLVLSARDRTSGCNNSRGEARMTDAQIS